MLLRQAMPLLTLTLPRSRSNWHLVTKYEKHLVLGHGAFSLASGLLKTRLFLLFAVDLCFPADYIVECSNKLYLGQAVLAQL